LSAAKALAEAALLGWYPLAKKGRKILVVSNFAKGG
jgi:hypothetical protein